MRGAFSGAALNRMFTNLMHPSKKGRDIAGGDGHARAGRCAFV